MNLIRVNLRNYNRTYLLIALLCIGAVGWIIVSVLGQPQRSVTAYCKELRQQQAIISHNARGDTYSSALFTSRSNNAELFADAFNKLDNVAPTTIEPNVHTLALAYQKMAEDPTQGILIGLSRIGAEDNVRRLN